MRADGVAQRSQVCTEENPSGFYRNRLHLFGAGACHPSTDCSTATWLGGRNEPKLLVGLLTDLCTQGCRQRFQYLLHGLLAVKGARDRLVGQ